MSTATPSLESLYNCRIGRMTKVELTEKYYGAAESDVEIIDTSAERRKRGMAGSFSFKLINHIRETLSEGGQVLLLRGRRAYSPSVQCFTCGDIPKCPHCNVPLSMHKQEGLLMCHYCGWRTPYTGICGKCGGELIPLGAGTQKIEEEVATLFPDAKVANCSSPRFSLTKASPSSACAPHLRAAATASASARITSPSSWTPKTND